MQSLLRRSFWIAVVLFVICAGLRVSLLKRQSIWADEAFSLAMASGHSIEHAAVIADPTKGDYVEPRDATRAEDYRKYLAHDSPPASPARVIRAVFLSDTSPPLYYLLLYGWTRVLGTGDSALRLFSVVASLLCFPILWRIARQIGGTRAAIFACAIYTFSPTAIYYGTEGRMYSLLWLFTLCTSASAITIYRSGPSARNLAMFIASAWAGMMTHYFFAFVLAALGLWLMIYAPRRSVAQGSRRIQSARSRILLAGFLIALLIAPWYAFVPATLAHWRVTDYWLNLVPANFNRPLEILQLPWSYFTLIGIWYWHRPIDTIAEIAFAALLVSAIVFINRRLISPKRLMLILCVLAACGGLVAFDFWRHTFVVDCPRYALAGFPAAIILTGFAIARLPKVLRYSLGPLIILLCIAGDRRILTNDVRIHPTQKVAWELEQNATKDDVIIVSSIPSGVANIARYTQFDPKNEPSFAGWTGQLGLRKVPDDLLRLSAGKKRVILVRMHEVVWPPENPDHPPHETWLKDHFKQTEDIKLQAAEIEIFEMPATPSAASVH